jgi:hypothetical protein
VLLDLFDSKDLNVVMLLRWGRSDREWDSENLLDREPINSWVNLQLLKMRECMGAIFFSDLIESNTSLIQEEEEEEVTVWSSDYAD